MLNTKNLTLIAGLLLTTPNFVLAHGHEAEPGAECTHTTTTPIIPDGNIASKDELVSAQTRVKAFQEELLDFRECLLNAEEKLNPEGETYAQDKAALSARSDSSIDLENKVAAEFNEAVKVYKAR